MAGLLQYVNPIKRLFIKSVHSKPSPDFPLTRFKRALSLFQLLTYIGDCVEKLANRYP